MRRQIEITVQQTSRGWKVTTVMREGRDKLLEQQRYVVEGEEGARELDPAVFEGLADVVRRHVQTWLRQQRLF